MITKQEATQRLMVANEHLPHLRLGQLIVNAVQEMRGKHDDTDTTQVIFYATDDTLVGCVETYVENADKL